MSTTCEFCHVDFSNPGALRFHYTRPTEECRKIKVDISTSKSPPVTCKFCSGIFQFKSELPKHQLTNPRCLELQNSG